MHVHRYRRALALVGALLFASAVSAQGRDFALAYQHDGQLVTGFRVYAGMTPTTLSVVKDVAGAAVRSTTVPGLAAGVWYFAVTALNGQIESPPSNVACASSGATPCSVPVATVPGPVRNLQITLVEPQVAISQISRTSYIQGTLQVGATAYIDRDYTFTTVGSLAGARYIRTASADRATASTWSFVISQPATVYVGYDTRNTTVPSWLSVSSGWTNTGVTIQAAGGKRLYSRQFPAGTVTLGQNTTTAVNAMYVVIVQ